MVEGRLGDGPELAKQARFDTTNQSTKLICYAGARTSLDADPDKGGADTGKSSAREPADLGQEGRISAWYALRDSNPCFRRERAAS
jgi:hypothetical protein